MVKYLKHLNSVYINYIILYIYDCRFGKASFTRTILAVTAVLRHNWILMLLKHYKNYLDCLSKSW